MDRAWNKTTSVKPKLALTYCVRHDKKMLEEKILRLKKLTQPLMAEMFNVQSDQIPPGNCSVLSIGFVCSGEG